MEAPQVEQPRRLRHVDRSGLRHLAASIADEQRHGVVRVRSAAPVASSNSGLAVRHFDASAQRF
ncbi:hypothetical protein [Brevundimonas sp.]|uniref:hypothetical protein n=1 Tax=Brevundimonas sp. TaxID=1871086 RepID=UPI002D7303B8|nr:hypothetical protein [Brevundimonas sp.]HYC73821.1 hypothetical protein [Brevundimonas sp.]